MATQPELISFLFLRITNNVSYSFFFYFKTEDGLRVSLGSRGLEEFDKGQSLDSVLAQE